MDSVTISVTGTREGMTAAQQATFRELLLGRHASLKVFRHGKCVGVDIQAARIVYEWRYETGAKCRIVAHPGLGNGDLEAADPYSDEAEPPLTNFARNRVLVERADLLVVMPKDTARQARGGTWYTYDRAKKAGKRLVVIWPDGSITREGFAQPASPRPA